MHIMLVCNTTKSVNLEWLSLQHYLLLSPMYQQTPLHVAASNGRDYTVEYLVRKGADMNIKDKKGVHKMIV